MLLCAFVFQLPKPDPVPVLDFLPDSCYQADLPVCLAPLDLLACFDCLLVLDCNPVNFNIELVKCFNQPVLPQSLHLGPQSSYLVQTPITENCVFCVPVCKDFNALKTFGEHTQPADEDNID